MAGPGIPSSFNPWTVLDSNDPGDVIGKTKTKEDAAAGKKPAAWVPSSKAMEKSTPAKKQHKKKSPAAATPNKKGPGATKQNGAGKGTKKG